jgi:ribonuclease HI
MLARGRSLTESNGRLKMMMEREGGALEWSGEANCEFEMDKSALMGFSRQMELRPFEQRRRQHIPRTGITIRGNRIQPVKSTRFLGVVINQTLSWVEQSAAALARGTEWALQCKRIAKQTHGIPPKMAQKLYLAACIPKFLYAVDVWGAPEKRRGSGRKCGGRLGKLERVQRQALLLIGAMRTTPTDTLEAHANLLPFHLLLDKVRHRALLRMATLPETNPINYHLARAHCMHVKRHKSPLHMLLAEYRDVKPGKVEKIQATRRCPQWKPPFSIHIEKDAKRAKERAMQRVEDVQIFTDGSGQDGRIGAAAVLWREGRRERCLQMYLGRQHHQIVYGAEVTGMILAMELLRTERTPFRSVFMGIDNQAAIRAAEGIKPMAGHHLVDKFQDAIENVIRLKGDFECKLHWTPGHAEIDGNEEADKRAKEAAEGTSSLRMMLPATLRDEIPHSRSAMKQAFMKKLRARAVRFWRKSPRYSRAVKVDDTMPSQKFMELTEKLSRSEASLILQLRTGHAPLNKHLHRFKRADSPMCPACGREEETVHHFVITCPARNGQRRKLERALGRGARSLPKMLTIPKMVAHLLQYVKDTGRMGSAFKIRERSR